MAIDVPIYEDGEPTGRAVVVPDPPPDRWADGCNRLELTVLEVCRRFGCGCVWEEVRAYVPEGSGVGTSATVRRKLGHEARRPAR